MMRYFYGCLACGIAVGLVSCKTNSVFNPKSSYPPDPWVKGYAGDNDCLGGEKLAAIDFELPEYPSRAFNTGRQGWSIIRLDVDAQGNTNNVQIERSLPEGPFDGASLRAVQSWKFAPPQDGPLFSCRVLLRYRGGNVSLGG
ncbi:MAG: energy transducer TonB [Litorimonas sp.]